MCAFCLFPPPSPGPGRGGGETPASIAVMTARLLAVSVAVLYHIAVTRQIAVTLLPFPLTAQGSTPNVVHESLLSRRFTLSVASAVGLMTAVTLSLLVVSAGQVPTPVVCVLAG